MHIVNFISVYLDSILVFSRSIEEHWQHRRLALDKLKEAKLYGRLHKCEFLKDCIDYLGFDVSLIGVHASPKKIKVKIEWPKLKDVYDLRSFLGVASYHKKLI